MANDLFLPAPGRRPTDSIEDSRQRDPQFSYDAALAGAATGLLKLVIKFTELTAPMLPTPFEGTGNDSEHGNSARDPLAWDVKINDEPVGTWFAKSRGAAILQVLRDYHDYNVEMLELTPSSGKRKAA